MDLSFVSIKKWQRHCQLVKLINKRVQIFKRRKKQFFFERNFMNPKLMFPIVKSQTVFTIMSKSYPRKNHIDHANS